MAELKHILKQLGGLATALPSKFRGDIFFRTALYVVSLQVGLAIASIFALSWVLFYDEGTSVVHNVTVGYVFGGIILMTTVFGSLLAYITLRPARNSLEYQKLFMSNVAHELRTPLSTIKTSIEVLLLDKNIDPEVRQTLYEALTETDRMSEIINNLLSLNKFLRPERMEFGDVDLGPIIDHVVRNVSPLANRYHIDIHVQKDEYRTVWGNAAGLEQVINNVVKNAVSYTPRERHGVVRISVEPDYRGNVVLAVTDNGVGIAQKDLFHIFEAFYRVDLSRNRSVKHGGSGLGLAIVSEIVRAHRGTIHMQSALGKGTTVSIILPTHERPVAAKLPFLTANKEPMNEVSVDFSKRAL